MGIVLSGVPIYDHINLTRTGPFDLYEATLATTILSITCSEDTGSGTPMLTVEKYNPSTGTSYIIRKRSMSPGETDTFDGPFRLERGWKIRVASSVANQVTAHISYFDPLLTYRPTASQRPFVPRTDRAPA